MLACALLFILIVIKPEVEGISGRRKPYRDNK
jgi:hypothetical protein